MKNVQKSEPKIQPSRETIEEWREKRQEEKAKAKIERDKFIARKKEELEYRRAKDHEKVRGIFHYHEVPNGFISFSYRVYPGDPIENWTFYDGKAYEIPYGVAKHLNNSGRYPRYRYLVNENGQRVTEAPGGKRRNETMRVQDWVKRYSFQSTDFTEFEDKPDILLVEGI